MKVDFIIVGAGLAGTLLAYELFRQNKTFIVFDDPAQKKASEVAAGLINPVVFRRMTKSWLVDDAFPQMETTYRLLEDLLQEQLYYPGRMMKMLSEDDIEFWKEKAFANQLETYLHPEPDFNNNNPNISSSFCFGLVEKSGRLDVQKLISLFSNFLNQCKSIRHEKLDFESLLLQSDSVSYMDLTSEKIIFCEGPVVSINPYFKNLKFKHSKGEILDLKIPELKLEDILNGDVFVLPVGENLYKVGSTYTWDELNWETTNSAGKELLDKLKSMISVDTEILRQKAGIRPTMHDRKPVIGLLPEHPQIGIFNGLGSKGVLLGPYFARQFADYLLGNSDFIHPEVNILRYFKRK